MKTEKKTYFCLTILFLAHLGRIMKTYIPQLDYLKSIFITLMILFHLVYIGDTYPYLKQVVYTFHMPIFLIFSGYLSGVDKSLTKFSLSIWWLFLPYAVMEVGYVVAATILPVREQVGELNVSNLLQRIFIDPVGPYWYLHTLMLCRILYFLLFQILRNRFSTFALLILTALCFWMISQGVGLMSFSYSMFFWMGIVIRLLKVDFQQFFLPSVWSLLPLIILCNYPDNLVQFNLAGVVIVYLVISFTLWLYSYLPQQIRSLSLFIGHNTLPMLLFSPIFTMLSRFYQPLFMFEPTGICFAIFTLVLTIVGCLAITWCLDKLKISPYFFGKKQMLNSSVILQ